MVSLDFHWVTDAVVGAARGDRAVGRGSRTRCSRSVTLGSCPSRPADRVAASGGDCWRPGVSSAPRSSSLPACPQRPRTPPPRHAGRAADRCARSPTPASRSSPGWWPCPAGSWPSTTGASRSTLYLLDGAAPWSTCHTAAGGPLRPGGPRRRRRRDRVGGRHRRQQRDRGRRSHSSPCDPTGPRGLFRLTYPDGPHDAEALLLAPDGTPYVVTKEVLGASSVYRPAAPLVDGGTVALGRVATVA